MAVERLLGVYSIERYGLQSLLKVKVSGLSAYLALSTVQGVAQYKKVWLHLVY